MSESRPEITRVSIIDWFVILIRLWFGGGYHLTAPEITRVSIVEWFVILIRFWIASALASAFIGLLLVALWVLIAIVGSVVGVGSLALLSAGA